nr:reverse transcriptase domain-containing protein [Tanacetum cinerariifolium]
VSSSLSNPESKRIGRYMYGLAPQIQGMVEATEPMTIHNVVQISGILIDEAFRNRTIKKNPKKRGNVGEPSKGENSSNTIAPNLPTKAPEYSLSLGDAHLSIILEMELDKVIKSSVENLVPIQSESEVTSVNKSKCDVPVKDESSPIFTTFSNPLFNCNDDFTSSDDESLSNEDVPMEDFKIYLNPLFDNEEIISNKIDPHYFNTKSNLIESLPNRDTLFVSSPKFDHLEEFSGELMPISIINEEQSLSNDSIPLLENESFNFDDYDELSFPHPPPEPPDVFFDYEPNLGELILAVMNNFDELIENECFDPAGGEIDVLANVEDDDYFPFMFVI